ncbi:MarR family transcriptional regulator [Staphylococcus condimenti]|uniref:MarR family transcriptional regulator n=1 Tax=Staphylococcus condimenti TaxID=70255 RepID=A0A143PCP6_9STAP|nr:MarR family transcriptional regulator [Staphylococcus condimenti]OFP02674.1 MarR family transcriptional regulator [Staphylococcus sp. HMSC065E08]AMY05534.1 MarR family transcriptional regulator [Staphylococcus condimenti]APR61739.1 MarR family transcriptional regulator [Staphylococcus condimenti]PNZ62701.1 MarR family transcriptional regulator [Staphylococcus condimenti]RZI01445.1 MarR family transcriptional regulator [Staphylococcus condimenti]
MEEYTLKKSKVISLLNEYKKYMDLMNYIETSYKINMNDFMVLNCIHDNCTEEKMLMQPFLKVATDSFELSRTKVLASIRKLVNQDRVSKVRSDTDERKVYLFMNESNVEKLNAMLDDIEKYLEK